MDLKRQIRNLFFVASAIVVSETALADSGGLFVEPGVTYQSTSTSVEYPAPLSHSSGNVYGLGVMARLGFHINDVIFVAADARYSRPTMKDSTNGYKADAEQFDLGPVVGIQMPVIGLRVWGTYIATATLDPKPASGVDPKYSGGKGYRVGAGFHVGIVSLNLEYQKIDYSPTTQDGWIASVSFPIEL